MQAFLQAARSGSSSRRGVVLDSTSCLLRPLSSLMVLPLLVLPLLRLLPPPLPLPLHAAAATAEEEEEREEEEAE